jgi:hypothetical protein
MYPLYSLEKEKELNYAEVSTVLSTLIGKRISINRAFGSITVFGFLDYILYRDGSQQKKIYFIEKSVTFTWENVEGILLDSAGYTIYLK